jgi:1-acyl-sn-glycerol-3-phosphate acyltransferase
VKRVFGVLYALVVLPFVMLAALLASLWIVPSAIVPRGRREAWCRPAARMFAWICVGPIVQARAAVVGAAEVPPGEGYLVVCNHRSWLDVALVMRETGAIGISKREIAFVPFFGLAGYLAGGIFFDRKSPTARAKVVGDALFLLRHGGRVLLFPEGTRTRTGRLADKVHLKLVKAAGEAGIAVVPACVWGTEKTAPASGIAAYPFQGCGIEIAPALRRRDFADADAFAEACWERVREMARRHGADEPFGAAA